jgi:hypothetical protein
MDDSEGKHSVRILPVSHIRGLCTLLAPTVLLVLTVGLFLTSPALAEFSRPYESSMDGTPTGPSGEPVPFGKTEGIAIDPTPSGNVWVGDGGKGVVDLFNSLDDFIEANTGVPTHSLAFDDSNGRLYGAPAREWVATDDSLSMEDGDVYHARQGNGDTKGDVEREKSNGEPANFTCSAPGSEEYISGNTLTGKPHESWGYGIRIKGIAVSSATGASAGYIYVINNTEHPEIDVFTSTGCFVTAITDASLPSGENFGPYITGVAIDPTNGDVLVEALRVVTLEGGAIDEFTYSGEYLGHVTGTSRRSKFKEEAFVEGGIAVDSEGHLYTDVYEKEMNEKSEVMNEKYTVDIFGPGAFYPEVVTGQVTDQSATSATATLTGVVRLPEYKSKIVSLTECYFEYALSSVFKERQYTGASKALCSPTQDGPGNQATDAVIGGLEPGKVYYYRLCATTSSAEKGGTKCGENATFAAASAPVVNAISVSDVSSSYAEFHAEIDPLGADTTYQFEYVDAASYVAGAQDPYSAGGTAPVIPGNIGSGDRDVNVADQVGGLLSNTTYHFRVVATNAVGVASSVDGVFTTLPAGLGSTLPDGRAYELVTPPNKGDAKDMFGAPEGVNFDLGYSSADGNEFLLLTSAAFGPFPASGENSYVFKRNAEKKEWELTSVASPSLGVQSLAAEIYDPVDFSKVGVVDNLGSEDLSLENLVGSPGGPYVNIASATAAKPVAMVGGSLELSHVVLEGAPDSELPFCEVSQQLLVEKQEKEVRESEDLYGWVEGHSCLTLVNVEEGSNSLISKCGAVLGVGESGTFPGSTHNAVSEDGSRTFFTAPDPKGVGSECWESGISNTPQVYMRSEEEGPSGEVTYTTTKVSAPAPGVTSGRIYPAVYAGASSDGSRVFFVTRTELTQKAVELKTHEPELYEYNVDGNEEATNWWEKKLVRISGGESEGTEGNVEDVPAISADGSTVYFNAKGDLSHGAANGGLYRYDTVTGETTYVAPPEEYPETPPGNGRWYRNGVVGPSESSLEDGLDLTANWYTTGDGRFLVFPSGKNITGYDANGQRELYRYDSTMPVSEGEPGIPDNPVCVSCNPNGAAPSNSAEFTRSAVRADNPAGAPPRPISENGEYVFFDTAESLVSQDSNGKIDVYEWHNGIISLISSGGDSADSFFLDSSDDGSNVFFGTHAQLVPQDTDTEGDLYDARICTPEDPCIKSQPGEAVQCEGGACQSPPSAPIEETPASLTFSGAGNLAVKATRTTKGKSKAKRGSKRKKKRQRKKKRPKPKSKAKRSPKIRRTGRTDRTPPSSMTSRQEGSR